MNYRQFKEWPFWNRAIKVISAMGTVVALFLIVCQIDRMGEQNKAMWYSMRPDIYIHPISTYDIKIRNTDSSITIRGDTIDYYNIHYKIENVGKSPALLDSVVKEYICGNWYKKTANADNRYLPQGISCVDNIAILLRKDRSNYFSIFYTYRWDNAEKTDEVFKYFKHYIAEFEDTFWSVHLTTPDTFEAHFSKIPDSMRF